jgi:hypothetical protein
MKGGRLVGCKAVQFGERALSEQNGVITQKRVFYKLIIYCE